MSMLRQASTPASIFGNPAAIAPHFAAMAGAEQKAAINLMRDRGYGWADIGDALGREVAEVEAIAVAACRPISPRGDPDDTRSTAINELRKRPVPKMAVERALDDALLAVDSLRAKAGSARAQAFDMTLEELCQACGFGPETARRRFRQLERLTFVSREIRPGLPALVTIEAPGRDRLALLSRRAAS
tara:strand:+ start:6209 stop:6769 length:561 start_codon:yes stop_codon:yes gene_type:complete